MHHSSATYLPLWQYNISSAFSHQLTCITHLLHTYHYYSTTSHLHSVVNLHASLICYILTVITVQHLIRIQSSTYTHHSSVTFLPFFLIITKQHFMSIQLSTYPHHSNVCLPLFLLLLSQYHIYIQSSTHPHHSSATLLLLLLLAIAVHRFRLWLPSY